MRPHSCSACFLFLGESLLPLGYPRMHCHLNTVPLLFSALFLCVNALGPVDLRLKLGTGPNSPCNRGSRNLNRQCCVWFDVLDDIQNNLFHGGECGDEAHESLRLTFHDAITFSKSKPFEGGADGSIMISDTEAGYVSNQDMADIIAIQKRFADHHRVSYADFIQFAGAVGAANCAGGPRLKFFVGRKQASHPSPDHLVPGPADSVDKILARMNDAGFSPQETVDLLASHSIAAQHGLDRTMNGAPLDSTPDTFDTQFFVETLLKGTIPPNNGTTPTSALSPIPGEFRMQSDYLLARDRRTACEWQSLIGQQSKMVSKFEAAMKKLSTLGSHPSSLVDCSDVIPTPKSSFRTPNAFLPPGRKMSDIEVSCHQLSPPSLNPSFGPLQHIPPVPPLSAH